MTFKNPRFALYHRQDDGCGACLTMELYPAQGVQCGYIRAIIAPQVDERFESGFDWQRRVQMNLGTTDLIAILAVLTGREDTLPNGEIVNESGDREFRVGLNAVGDSEFEMMMSCTAGDMSRSQNFILTAAEGEGLRAIIEGCLHIVVFGR